MHIRRAPVELRGREVTGLVAPVGEVAVVQDSRTGAMIREVIMANAFSVADDVSLNLQHQPSNVVARPPALRFSESSQGLRMSARLDGPDADLGYELLNRRTLTGLSAEYLDLDRRSNGGIDEVHAAKLVGLALVDRPAFAGASVQLRVGASVEGLVPTSAILRCRCKGPDEIQDVRFEAGAFRQAIDGDDEILAVAGNYTNALASKRRGTLQLTEDEGGLRARFSLPDTSAARDLIGESAVADLVVRPIIDDEASEFEDRDGVRIFRNVYVRALLVGATDAADGWPVLALGAAAAALPTRRDRAVEVSRVWQ